MKQDRGGRDRTVMVRMEQLIWTQKWISANMWELKIVKNCKEQRASNAWKWIKKLLLLGMLQKTILVDLDVKNACPQTHLS